MPVELSIRPAQFESKLACFRMDKIHNWYVCVSLFRWKAYKSSKIALENRVGVFVMVLFPPVQHELYSIPLSTAWRQEAAYPAHDYCQSSTATWGEEQAGHCQLVELTHRYIYMYTSNWNYTSHSQIKTTVGLEIFAVSWFNVLWEIFHDFFSRLAGYRPFFAHCN